MNFYRYFPNSLSDLGSIFAHNAFELCHFRENWPRKSRNSLVGISEVKFICES